MWIFCLTGINLLIGSNGLWKSNFLGIFEMLHAITTRNLQTYVTDSGGAEYCSSATIAADA